MSKIALSLVCCLLLLSGCRINRIDTHKLELVDINRHDTSVNGWIFADLRGDESDLLISIDTQQPILHSMYVQDTKGKVISQTNSQYQFRALKVLQEASTNNNWLFYSYNDTKTVYLDAIKYTWQVPLQRETKRFLPLARNDSAINNPKIEYYGQLIPEVLDDLDGDGSLELLCRGIDSFTANPRGLFAYDFETGKLKWRYDMPCNPNSVLWDDFDGDGSYEIVASNHAFKNTPKQINGLDDASGWIIVLSSEGNLLYQERQFHGYGQVYLAAVDTNKNGLNEIYAVNSTWGSEIHRNAVTLFAWNGNRLVRRQSLELPSTLERYQVPEFVQKMSSANKFNLHLTDKNTGLLVLDEELQPVAHGYKAFVKQIWDIGDLDRDGNKEILLQTDDDYLEVVDKNYARRCRIKNPFPDEQVFSLKIIRTGFDSPSLVAVGSGREMRYYSYKLLPIQVLGYSIVSRNLGYIALLLVVLLSLLLYRNKMRQRVFVAGANLLGEGIIVVSESRKVLFCNQIIHQLAEKHNFTCRKDFAKNLPQLNTLLQSFIQNKQESRKTLTALRFDDERRYHVTIMKMPGLNKDYMIILCPDHGDDLAQSDKILWADSARRLSHHVRRHITNIILSLEMLARDTDVSRLEYYQIIKDEIEKVRVFTHAFQRFTELKDYDLKLQDIVPSVEHCLSRTALPENIKLIKSWNLHSVAAYIEPIRFEEAVSNAINNALEAMPEGGTLHISIKEFPHSAAYQGNLRVLVEIEDTGCGIPEKYMEDIWKPFFTTNQSGTGIGIPESQKIIQSMGGIMDIQSEEGVGTIVSYWLKGENDA